MPTIEQEQRWSSEELLQEVSHLAPSDLDAFVTQVLVLRAERHAPHLSKEETTLLLKINRSLPQETWNRQQILDKKRRAETLTSEEQQELIQLNAEIEEDHSRRLSLLAELAQLRHTTLDEVMKSLGIGPGRHA